MFEIVGFVMIMLGMVLAFISGVSFGYWMWGKYSLKARRMGQLEAKNERIMKLAADYIKAYEELAFIGAKNESLNDHAMSHHLGVAVCDDPDCPWNIEEKEDESAD